MSSTRQEDSSGFCAQRSSMDRSGARRQATSTSKTQQKGMMGLTL